MADGFSCQPDRARALLLRYHAKARELGIALRLARAIGDADLAACARRRLIAVQRLRRTCRAAWHAARRDAREAA